LTESNKGCDQVQYYAITKYGMSKTAPFALLRMNQGVFEIHQNGQWSETDQYDGILIGDFSEYDVISVDEAGAIIQGQLA
jgi:hypothetical protein